MNLHQKMILAPQIIQSIEILQLPIMALQERIDQELLENPALDCELNDPEETEEEEPQERQEERSSENDDPELEARIEELGADWGDYFSGRSGGRYDADEEDRKMAAMSNTAANSESLQEHLLHQLVLLDLDQPGRDLAEEIIFSLDGNGYLLYPLEELVVASNGNPEEYMQHLEATQRALKIVQSLEPLGVACRDIKECLLLQIPDEPEHQLPRRIIENHLDDLRMNRLPKIAKDTGRTIEDIKSAIAYIGTLNPYPGRDYGQEELQYVIPDVILDFVDEKYEIRLQDGYVPSLSISPTYARMLKDAGSDSATKDFVRKKIQSARWLIESIEQRRSTVYKIANELVEQQRDFLDRGVAFLKPLKMQAVADKVGVHVSTVSRAISDKYIQTPRGIFPMKYFFTGGIESADGESVSTKSVQQALTEIIDKEDKQSPLSDEEIVAKLKEKGMSISRRTVTKYRKQLNIPSSRQRREY